MRTMGNEYSSHRKGTAKFTRSGEPMPKMPEWHKPQHRSDGKVMSLQLHLDDIRQRVYMTPPEREWRKFG